MMTNRNPDMYMPCDIPLRRAPTIYNELPSFAPWLTEGALCARAIADEEDGGDAAALQALLLFTQFGGRL